MLTWLDNLIILTICKFARCGVISWSNKKQLSSALRSRKAEYEDFMDFVVVYCLGRQLALYDNVSDKTAQVLEVYHLCNNVEVFVNSPCPIFCLTFETPCLQSLDHLARSCAKSLEWCYKLSIVMCAREVKNVATSQ